MVKCLLVCVKMKRLKSSPVVFIQVGLSDIINMIQVIISIMFFQDKERLYAMELRESYTVEHATFSKKVSHIVLRIPEI